MTGIWHRLVDQQKATREKMIGDRASQLRDLKPEIRVNMISDIAKADNFV